MAGSGRCIFCGVVGTMTGEDVLGRWLQGIDLDQGPVPHSTGWLNRIGRKLGARPPYRQRVRDVCRGCNCPVSNSAVDLAFGHVRRPWREVLCARVPARGSRASRVGCLGNLAPGCLAGSWPAYLQFRYPIRTASVPYVHA